MKLVSLKTENFRNLEPQTLTLFDGINVLYGKNASGKTNTLECAYVFASGKSFRTRYENEVIKRGENTAFAEIEYTGAAGTKKMSVTWHKNKDTDFTRRMTYEDYELSKASEFLGNFRAVLFTPNHLSLIKGSPEERRRFMDIALSQISPRYVYCLNNYLKMLTQKNAYLKKVSFGAKVDSDYLDVLNIQLAKAASVLVKQRSGLADSLRIYAKEMYSGLTASKENLDVKYLSATKENFSDPEYTESRYAEIYKADVQSEIKQGRTIHGPHKDDLAFYISKNSDEEKILEETNDAEYGENEEAVSEFSARSFGSQGQQRSAVLAIKLAEGEIFNSITGEYPVLLLDDLLGELDSQRQSALIKLIRDKQAIISHCDRNALKRVKNVNYIMVDNGKYYPDAKEKD
jgi:DNA replication and repair protein RecF